MIERWIEEIKVQCPPSELGMIVVHNGIVRATNRKGEPVAGMELSYDRVELEKLLTHFRAREGIVAVKAWINEGVLPVGADIMKVCLAGRFRTDVLPALEELVGLIKTTIVREKEITNVGR